MRGLLGGMLTGGLVSALGLGTASVMSEQPAGALPPDAPLVQAPSVETVNTVDAIDAVSSQDASSPQDAPSTPVGSLTVQAPQAPDLPEDDVAIADTAVTVPAAPAAAETTAPRADTDPLDEPVVSGIEGALEAPDAPELAGVTSQPVEPVLPNPQSVAPQVPETEADLAVSTTPAQPTVVVVPDADVAADEPEVPPSDGGDGEFFVVDLGADAPVQDIAVQDTTDQDTPDTEPAQADPAVEVVNDDVPEQPEVQAQSSDDAEAVEPDATVDATTEQPEDEILAAVEPAPSAPRVQLQGGGNALPGNSDNGVVIRRPASSESQDANVADVTTDALTLFGADAGDFGSKPLMSVILIDDGSMSAAAAALAGVPFSITIALDPAMPNATDLMAAYRAAGFEIAVLAKVPEGAVPTDVEVAFESAFSTLPETIAVLDVGDGGLQNDRDVTEQAMEILASQGRGFINASQGLNMAGRAADKAGVPAAVIYRDLDGDDQDARVVRRFVDQAAFRARQDSGVVLVGRVRPDTISALILWGTANQDEQVAVVPVSAVLTRAQ